MDIKNMQNKSNILETIFKFLMILVILFLAIFFILSRGININNIDNDFLTIQKLYIKLDKKIILNAKNIKLNFLNSSNKKEKTPINEENIQTDILAYMSKFNFINEIFSSIDIENLSYNNIHTNISFSDNNFKIENEYILLDLNAQKTGNMFYIKSNELFFKQQNLKADLELKVNLRLKHYDLSMSANNDYFHTDINITKDKNIANIYIKKLLVTDIKKFEKDFFSALAMPKPVKEWVFDRAVGKKYELNETKITLNTKKAFDTKKLDLKIKVSDVDVRFHDKAKIAKIKEVIVAIKNNHILISYDNGVYNKTTLSKGGVDILNALSGKNVIVNVKLSGENISLDGDVLEVLNAYNIKTGVSVLNAKSKINLQISINTHQDTIDATLDANVKSGFLEPLGLLISNAKVSMKDSKIYIKTLAKKDMINGDVDGVLDLKSHSGKFEAKNVMVNLKDYIKTNTPQNIIVEMDYSNNINLDIKQLKTKINITSKALKLHIEDISPFLQYSKILQSVGLQQAKVDMDYQDGVFEVIVKDIKTQNGFLFIDNKPYFSQKITLNYSKDFLNINDFEKNIFININSDKYLTANIQNIAIWQNKQLDDFLQIINNEKQNNEKNTTYKNHSIKANNIKFLPKNAKNYITLNNIYTPTSPKDPAKLKAQAFIDNKKQADITVFKSDDLSIFIEHIKPEIINLFANKELFSGGELSLRLKGKSLEEYKSEVRIYGTLLKDFKTYQRVIDYINAIPNLLVFKKTDLREKGFVVNSGVIKVSKQDGIYLFKEINLKGSNVDIKGSGVFDEEYKNINMVLDLITIKSISSIIANTPIISQVVLGDKKQISTRLLIKGTIDDMKVSSNIANEIIQTPFSIIKNIVTLPANLLK